MDDRLPGCVICRASDGDAELDRILVWDDTYWRLTVSLSAEVLGFTYLEPKRHIRDIAELDGMEAQSFGTVIARASRVLREETGAEVVYVYIFGDGVRHFHVHLAPHRAGDALNDQMIRGEMQEEKLASGFTRFTSRQFPPLPEQDQRALGLRVRQRLAEFR